MNPSLVFNPQIKDNYKYPNYSEFDRISKIAKARKKETWTLIGKKCDQIMEQFGIESESKLSKRDAHLILDIIGIELNQYQKIEFDQLMARSHCFTGESLKYWIFKNRNFLLCKVIDRKSVV